MNNYNPIIHHRHSIRLKGYDYSRSGLYFITIDVKDRKCLFGGIINCKMILNDAGKIADECWLEIPDHFPNAVLHEHIIKDERSYQRIREYIFNNPVNWQTDKLNKQE